MEARRNQPIDNEIDRAEDAYYALLDGYRELYGNNADIRLIQALEAYRDAETEVSKLGMKPGDSRTARGIGLRLQLGGILPTDNAVEANRQFALLSAGFSLNRDLFENEIERAGRGRIDQRQSMASILRQTSQKR